MDDDKFRAEEVESSRKRTSLDSNGIVGGIKSNFDEQNRYDKCNDPPDKKSLRE